MSSVQPVHILKQIRTHTVPNPGLNKSNKCENCDVLNLFLVNIRESDYMKYKMKVN